MDCQAALSISVTQCGPTSATTPLRWPTPATVHVSCPAKQLAPQRGKSWPSKCSLEWKPAPSWPGKHEVSRKFLYRQAHTAQEALSQAFSPPPTPDGVVFHVPVTKAWLRQLVLALVLICHSSYRCVVELLSDHFGFPISLGTVHNIIHSAVAQAQRINQQYDLPSICIGAHDEIFQASDPVLVGVDTASSFCYLLSLEGAKGAAHGSLVPESGWPLPRCVP